MTLRSVRDIEIKKYIVNYDDTDLPFAVQKHKYRCVNTLK